MAKQIDGQRSWDDYRLPLVSVRLRLEEEKLLYSTRPIDSAQAAVSVMQNVLRELDREMLCVVNLDSKGRAISANIASIGALNYSVVDVANVFKTSILTANAAEILLIHNHPSGNTLPSNADIEVTKRISQAGALLGIPLRDHIIVGSGVHAEDNYSFRDHYPDMFSGVYDPDFISKMVSERSTLTDTVTEISEEFMPLTHGRTL